MHANNAVASQQVRQVVHESLGQYLSPSSTSPYVKVSLLQACVYDGK